jgi:Lon-like protease
MTADAGAPGSPPRRRRRTTVAVVTAGVLGVALVAAAFVKVPYVIISPGAATPLDDVVRVAGAPTYEHRGELLFLTVRVSNNDPNLYRWLVAQLDGEVSVEPREDVLGCASYAATARLNGLLMQESQDAAKAVALRELGYEVLDESSRVIVLDVQCDGPSNNTLEPGDEIVAIDGQPVTTADEVRPAVQSRTPGDRLTLTIRRAGEQRDVTVRLGRRDGAAFLGIVSQTLVRSRLPLDVEIDTRRVSGPSAGLAFTLAIIDDLTPGDLTGGSPVAVTGSIGRDGAVGVVGGVGEKAVTAREDGVALMLVPAGEAKVARERVGDDVKIVPVGTIDEALRALRRAGGDPLPPGAPDQ